MSTFSGLTRAYSGLSAARQQLDIIGQNITNANTEGYVRQRVTTTSAVAALGAGLMFAGTPQAGAGVTVNGIARLSSNLLDAQVRTTAAANGYWTETATNFSGIESSLNEPGTAGLSTGLQAFWTSWQNLSNHAGEAAPTSVMLQAANQVVSQVASGYNALASQWSTVRGDVGSTVTDINQAATTLASLNDQIRQTQAAGGTGNDLTDQRDLLATKLATLTGGTVRDRGDGMVDIVVGGNTLVSGASSRAVVATGAAEMAGAAATPVQLEFADRPGVAIDGVGGKLAADFSMLAAANATGTGGAIAEAAQGFNAIATTIAASVNALHSTGATPDGTTGLNFFALDATKPAALGLSVIPTDATGVAAGSVSGGALNGSMADQIAQLSTAAAGPDAQWSKFVVSIGVSSRAATSQATITQAASSTAVTNQASEESVDTDEETTMMLTFQHAYEAAARVMTTVDDMLDTLINKTGLVGR